MNCPLCENKEISKLKNIKKKDLLQLYKKLTKIDFSYLINQDINLCECKKCKLKFYYPLITGDEKFYNSLQHFNWYYGDGKKEHLDAALYINFTDKVLEVGSGKGTFVKYLPTKDYTGLDFSSNAKAMAAENGVVIENEMIEDYALNNENTFDVVVSFQVLEHVMNPRSFLEAKIKSLKVGGKMIIAVPSEDSFLKYCTNNILNMPPHHVTLWSDITFKFIANEFNLEILDISHEKVQEVHKLQYLNTLIGNSLSQNKLIDTSLGQKFKNKVVSIFSRLFIRGLKDEMLPNGHNVLVVYKKGSI